jgi:hypothetical protein
VAPVVSAATDNIASTITNWVADGARTVLGWLGNLVDGTTTPHLEAEWFRAHYRAMVALAGLVVLPLLISSILGAVVHQDPGRLVRTVFGYLPMAGIFTAGAVSLVILGLKITDDLSSWVGAGTGAAAGDFLGKAAAALSTVGANPGGQFLVFLGGLILAVGAVAVWLELLIRSAAIYVAVLFLPLALAGMVWPATSHWIKRLTHLLVAVILSKFVIVAILALAASGLAAAPTDGGGFGSVLAGGALLTLAAFSPMALLRMAPIVEANLASAVGTGGAGTKVTRAASGTAREGGRSLVDQAQSWNLRDKTTPPPRTWRSFEPSASGGTSGSGAAGPVGVAAMATGRAAQSAGRHTSGLANGAGRAADNGHGVDSAGPSIPRQWERPGSGNGAKEKGTGDGHE